MKSIHRIGIVVTALIGAAGATAHHIHETPLSSGYVPILKAALHQARVAVRTDKDRESEAKLENSQADFDSRFVMDCSPQNASSILSGEGLDEEQ
jgi:hypothetical protein